MVVPKKRLLTEWLKAPLGSTTFDQIRSTKWSIEPNILQGVWPILFSLPKLVRSPQTLDPPGCTPGKKTLIAARPRRWQAPLFFQKPSGSCLFMSSPSLFRPELPGVGWARSRPSVVPGARRPRDCREYLQRNQDKSANDWWGCGKFCKSHWLSQLGYVGFELTLQLMFGA